MKTTFSTLALAPSHLVFGRTKTPIRCHGVAIGEGRVIPEIKFTLPSILIEEANL